MSQRFNPLSPVGFFKGNSVSSAPKKRPRKVASLPHGLQFDDFEKHKLCAKLAEKIIIPTRYVDEDCLRTLGLLDEVVWMFSQVGMNHFIALKQPTNERLTLEFLSTLRFELETEEGSVEFSLLGHDHHMTLGEFNALFGFPNVGARKVFWDNEHSFWHSLTGEEWYRPAKARSTSIFNPVFRYVHLVLANTVFGRNESQKIVSRTELYFLECMLKGSPINVGAFMLEKMKSIIENKRGAILIGGYITVLAQSLGLKTSHLSYIEGYRCLDIKTCERRRIIQKVDDRFWLYYRDSSIYPLPNQISSVRDQTNWRPQLSHLYQRESENVIGDEIPPHLKSQQGHQDGGSSISAIGHDLQAILSAIKDEQSNLRAILIGIQDEQAQQRLVLGDIQRQLNEQGQILQNIQNQMGVIQNCFHSKSPIPAVSPQEQNHQEESPLPPPPPPPSLSTASIVDSPPLENIPEDSSLFSAPQIPISWPQSGTLCREWVNNLMHVFEWASKVIPPHEFPNVFPLCVFDRLILFAHKILHKEKNCVMINEELNSSSRVVVVGDLHGQLHDILFLLNDAGFPNDDRVFVFNGDYVDRGAWGLETFLLMLAWKVLLPHRVFLLRGNHESKYCTSVYGFQKEVMVKYGDKGNHVYNKLLECFKELPLASVIANRVFTAHGGLFRSPATAHTGDLSLGSFEELSKARRRVLDPKFIVGDVLWSDPSMSRGLSLNEERGVGLLWGPDCTEAFLKKFALKLIIRSHEGPDARYKRDGLTGMDDGYTIDHEGESGKLITVFSAPDYPQFQATKERYRNKGAYIVLEPPDFDTPFFHTFEAVSPRPEVNPYYDYEDVIDSDEELDVASMEPDDEVNVGSLPEVSGRKKKGSGERKKKKKQRKQGY